MLRRGSLAPDMAALVGESVEKGGYGREEGVGERRMWERRRRSGEQGSYAESWVTHCFIFAFAFTLHFIFNLPSLSALTRSYQSSPLTSLFF